MWVISHWGFHLRLARHIDVLWKSNDQVVNSVHFGVLFLFNVVFPEIVTTWAPWTLESISEVILILNLNGTGGQDLLLESSGSDPAAS